MSESSPSKRNKGNVTFPIDFAFIPSDGRSLSQFSLMPDHLIRIGNGVMAVSRTFTWWITCTICVICVSAKRSFCPSSSRTRSHYHSHTFHSHTFQLGSECGTQQQQNALQSGKQQNASQQYATGINMVSLIRGQLVTVFVTTKDKCNFLKLLLLL